MTIAAATDWQAGAGAGGGAAAFRPPDRAWGGGPPCAAVPMAKALVPQA